MLPLPCDVSGSRPPHPPPAVAATAAQSGRPPGEPPIPSDCSFEPLSESELAQLRAFMDDGGDTWQALEAQGDDVDAFTIADPAGVHDDRSGSGTDRLLDPLASGVYGVRYFPLS